MTEMESPLEDYWDSILTVILFGDSYTDGLEMLLGTGYEMHIALANLLFISSNLIFEAYCMAQVFHPLCDRNMISARLDAVSEIVMSMGSC